MQSILSPISRKHISVSYSPHDSFGYLKIITLDKYFIYEQWHQNATATDIHQRFQTSIPPCCVMVSSAMGLNLGVFGFLPTTHTKMHVKQMRSQSLRAVWHFVLVCHHA